MHLEDVRQACVALQALGVRPSANAIVARLGGSKRDAVHLLAQLRAEEQPEPPRTPVPSPPPPVARTASVPEDDTLVPADTVVAPAQVDAVEVATRELAQAEAAEWALAQRHTALHQRQRDLVATLRLLHARQEQVPDHARERIGERIIAAQDTLVTLGDELAALEPAHVEACHQVIAAKDAYRLAQAAAWREARAQQLQALTTVRET